MSNAYDSYWNLTLEGISKDASSHIMANGYANAWVIDPAKMDGRRVLQGRISLTFQMYFYVGVCISAITLLIIVCVTVAGFIRRNHEKK
jgi:hypothetical protein